MNEPATIHALLQARTIAVIGISADPTKPSHYVSAYMQRRGHCILPVNPSLTEVLCEVSYPNLAALPIRPELINVFRLPRFIPAIVDDLITLYSSGPMPGLWIQQGIVHPEAAARAESHGIRVVMDRCLMIEARHAAR